MSFVRGDGAAAVEPEWCMDWAPNVPRTPELPPGGGYVVWCDGKVIGPRFACFEMAERECVCGVVATWDRVRRRLLAQGNGRIVRVRMSARGAM